jgi:hypothetical protein
LWTYQYSAARHRLCIHHKRPCIEHAHNTLKKIEHEVEVLSCDNQSEKRSNGSIPRWWPHKSPRVFYRRRCLPLQLETLDKLQRCREPLNHQETGSLRHRCPMHKVPVSRRIPKTGLRPRSIHKNHPLQPPRAPVQVLTRTGSLHHRCPMHKLPVPRQTPETRLRPQSGHKSHTLQPPRAPEEVLAGTGSLRHRHPTHEVPVLR